MQIITRHKAETKVKVKVKEEEDELLKEIEDELLEEDGLVKEEDGLK
jgi:hypothetical protein